MNKNYHMIANWKMNLSFNEACSLAKNISDHFRENTFLTDTIACIICPSFDSLSSVAQILKNSPISIGAQTCSSREKGNFTGEVSAQSLKELECNYVIVGHNERRTYHHETDLTIASILKNLFKQKITPILCIGETQQDYNEKKTLEILEKQLLSLFSALQEYSPPYPPCIIAYEPTWAIGTNETVPQHHLEHVFTFLKNKVTSPNNPTSWKLVYGGGVSEVTLSSLLKIDSIEGFLVGRASTHLQQLESMLQHIRKLTSFNLVRNSQ